MKSHSLRMMIVPVVVAVGLQSIVLASGWNRSVTITSVGDNNVSGEVVQFTVNEVVDNPGPAALGKISPALLGIIGPAR
jgi:hypothetical protein